MHELSIAAGILDLIGPKVSDKTKLDTVHITIGPLAGIFSESLEFCFNELASQEGFSRARICINKVPAQFHCTACEKKYEVRGVEEVCPFCGSMQRRLLSGAQCTIDCIEVEE